MIDLVSGIGLGAILALGFMVWLLELDRHRKGRE